MSSSDSEELRGGLFGCVVRFASKRLLAMANDPSLLLLGSLSPCDMDLLCFLTLRFRGVVLILDWTISLIFVVRRDSSLVVASCIAVSIVVLTCFWRCCCTVSWRSLKSDCSLVRVWFT